MLNTINTLNTIINPDAVTIGTDPEVFLTQKGQFVSAYGLVSGNKRKPFTVKDGAVQVDGMALEFNISPASNIQEFLHNIESVYSQLREMVPPDFEFSDKATAKFNPVYFGERKRIEVRMGCEKDYCAYTEEPNPKPDDTVPVRTAGGHVHIGWRNPSLMKADHVQLCVTVAKMCDLFLGLPSLVYDKDVERRVMYGAAGCYRPKPYGIEYRTLSNAWVMSKELQAHVYNNVQKMLQRQDEWTSLLAFTDRAQSLINSKEPCAGEAIGLMNLLGIEYP